MQRVLFRFLGSGLRAEDLAMICVYLNWNHPPTNADTEGCEYARMLLQPFHPRLEQGGDRLSQTKPCP